VGGALHEDSRHQGHRSQRRAGPALHQPLGARKKLADIAFNLIIEVAHVVNCSLKTLQGLNLLKRWKRRKYVLYFSNEEVPAPCRRYDEMRVLSGL
jgi:predicted MarR family transcription regulator